MSFHAHAHLITVTKCCHGDRYVNLPVHAHMPTCTDVYQRRGLTRLSSIFSYLACLWNQSVRIVEVLLYIIGLVHVVPWLFYLNLDHVSYKFCIQIG